jgi:hypothetical protein
MEAILILDFTHMGFFKVNNNQHVDMGIIKHEVHYLDYAIMILLVLKS